NTFFPKCFLKCYAIGLERVRPQHNRSHFVKGSQLTLPNLAAKLALASLIQPVGDRLPDLSAIGRLTRSRQHLFGRKLFKFGPRWKVHVSQRTPYGKKSPEVISFALTELAKPAIPSNDIICSFCNKTAVACAPAGILLQQSFDYLISI